MISGIINLLGEIMVLHLRKLPFLMSYIQKYLVYFTWNISMTTKKSLSDANVKMLTDVTPE